MRQIMVFLVCALTFGCLAKENEVEQIFEGSVCGAASAGTCTAEDVKAMEEQHRKVVAAINLDVTMPMAPQPGGGGSAGSFVTSEGRLHYFENGVGLRFVDPRKPGGEDLQKDWLEQNQSPREERSLKMALLPEEKASTPPFERPEMRAAYVWLFGEEAAREVEGSGGGTARRLSYMEQFFACVIDPCPKTPLNAAVRAELKARMKTYDVALGRLLAGYRACGKGKSEPRAVKALFQAFDDTKAAEQACWDFKRDGLLTQEQQRAKRAAECQNEDTSDMISRTGDDYSFKGNLKSSKGCFTGDIKVAKGNGGQLLDFFLNEICNQRMGKVVSCEMDSALRSKPICGQLKFGGAEEGLDQIAKLVKSKLTKKGEGYQIAP